MGRGGGRAEPTPLMGPVSLPLFVRDGARGGARGTPNPRHGASVGSLRFASRAAHRHRDVCPPPVRQRGGRGAGVPLGFTAPAAPAAVRVRDNYRRVSRSSDLFLSCGIRLTTGCWDQHWRGVRARALLCSCVVYSITFIRALCPCVCPFPLRCPVPPLVPRSPTTAQARSATGM